MRHGATEWSVAGRHTGRTDMALTVDGVAQAHAAAAVIEMVVCDVVPPSPGIDAVFTSPLQRARATAEIVFGGAPLQADDDLMEFDSRSVRARIPQP